MKTTNLIVFAALLLPALAACGSADTPVTGKTESLPLLASPVKTDTTPSVVPSAGPAVGGTPTAAAPPPGSTADMAKEMSRQDESSRMPLAGQGNNHSLPNSTPAAKPPAN
jgi:hypothetical protein